MTSITFKISEEEKEAIKKFAEKNDLSISQVLRKAAKEFIEKENN